MRKGFVFHHDQADHPVYKTDSTHRRCEAFWRAVRNYHVNTKGWSDIAYSFGVCPHGVRFVGRGWDKSQWANGSDQVGFDDGSDAYWYTVLLFIGGPEAPNLPMIAALETLVEEGRNSGRCGLRVLPHNDFKRKVCPGVEATALARAWDNRPHLGTVPLPIEVADLQADERDWLYAIYTACRPRDYDGNGTVDTPWLLDGVMDLLARTQALQAAVAAIPKIDQKALADAIVARIPAPGTVDPKVVEKAVADAVAAAVSKLVLNVGVKP